MALVLWEAWMRMQWVRVEGNAAGSERMRKWWVRTDGNAVGSELMGMRWVQS